MHVCISTDLYTKIFKRRNALRSKVKYKQISFGAAIHPHTAQGQKSCFESCVVSKKPIIITYQV